MTKRSKIIMQADGIGTGMYLEHFNLNTSPFQEQVDPSLFYPGAGRQAILDALLADLGSGKSLIKFTGDEGSGKTLMCRLLGEKISPGGRVLYLENPVGSFDNLLRLVSLDLGVAPGSSGETINSKEMLQQFLAACTAAIPEGRVVLIIDEAEKLFLATLERLVRLCSENRNGNLQIVLAGRPGLDANLEQLSHYCAEMDIQGGYFLKAMDEDETGEYLNFRLKAAGLISGKPGELFTRGAVQKIFEMAKGNPRLTNILAEESLQTSCQEKSFLVLLDHVQPEEEKPVDSGLGSKMNGLLNRLPWDKRFLALGASALALVVVMGLMLLGGDKETGKPGEVPGQQLKQTPDEVQDSPQTKIAEPTPVPQALPPGPPEVQAQPKPEPLPAVTPPPGPATPPADQVKAPSVETTATDKPEAPPATVQPQPEERNADALFEQRLRASSGWVAGAYRGAYTIQLMKLSSEQAVDNIKRDLAQDPYYQVLDQIYILRKMTSPPTIFVFFGSFQSLEEARRQRNNMPVFLRKHYPYPLSISDAMKKTQD